MKKTILTMLVAVGFVCFSQAQTTSANIVGYAKVAATAGELSLVALNFTPSSSSISDIIGDQLPAGSVLHIWNKSTGGYDTVNKAGRGGWGSGTINLGDAFWIQAGGSGTYDVILSGDVNTSGTNSSTLAAGIDATGLFFPVETAFQSTDLADDLPAGSVLHIWNDANQGYDTYNKAGRGGWNGNPVIGPSTGFWVEAAAGLSWDETRPFSF